MQSRLRGVAIALAAMAIATPVLAATSAGLAIANPDLKGPKTLKVSSPKIAPGAAIAELYSGYSQSVSPPLAWSKGPYGSRSFVLIIEDPDAPLPMPFIHWMVWDIPLATTSVAQGAIPAGGVQGKLMFVGKVGYMGPRPPAGPAHHYHFEVFALDRSLELAAGAERTALLDAMKGHVLASGELVGTYSKP